jgi:hypothetical protein
LPLATEKIQMSEQQTMPENPVADAVRAGLEPASLPQPCCTLRPDVALDELQLLTDLRACLPERTSEGRIVSIGSAYLIELLQATPASPWEKLTPHRLERLLRVFGLYPRTMRFPDGVSRGYICDELRGAFLTHLPIPQNRRRD